MSESKNKKDELDESLNALVSKEVGQDKETKTVSVLTKEDQSDTKEELKKGLTTPSYDSLQKVDYVDLLETFTALGIPDAWKPGSKKDSMIAKALELLAVKRDLESKGLEGQDLTEAVKAKDAENNEATQAQAIKEAADKVAKAKQADKDLKSKIEGMNLSKAQVEANIKGINANLKIGVPAQRNILLKKLEILEGILEADKFEETDN